MSMIDGANGGRHGNALLSALPDEQRRRVMPYLESVTVEVGDQLYEPGAPITYLYFPETALISLVHLVADCPRMEFTVVGREGFAGLAAFLGATTASRLAVVQIAGRSFRLSRRELPTIAGDLAFDAVLKQYTQACLTEMSLSTVCRLCHPISQRLMRWLLTVADRVGHEEFELTQEFLAQMLGVSRQTTSTAASRLQHMELIRYSSGQVVLLDRQRLSDLSCGCYSLIRDGFVDVGGQAAT